METKKPLRAKKTMTPSSRKQIEMLNGIKNGQVAEAPTANNLPSDGNHVPSDIVGGKGLCCDSQKGLGNHPEPDQSPLSAPFKEPVTNLIVNSEISIYNGSQELPKGSSACVEDSDIEQFWDGDSLQDILYDLCKKESQSPSFIPVEVHLDIKPPRLLLEESEGQLSGRRPVARSPPSTADKMPTMPVLRPETDNAQSPGNVADASLLLDSAQRKRKHSDASRRSLSKNSRAAREGSGASSLEGSPSGLAKVKVFIQRQLDLSAANMDHNLQRLNEKIDQNSCLRKHEGITIKIIKKISRLEKRINDLVSFQKARLSRKVPSSRAKSQHKMPSATNSLPDKTSSELLLAEEKSPNPNNVPSEIAGSSGKPRLGATSQRTDVEAVGTAGKNGRRHLNLPSGEGVTEKLAPAHRCLSAETSCDSKNSLLIDLTDEGNDERICRRKEKRIADSSPEILAVDSPEPVIPSLDEFSHLPPLPGSHSPPAHRGAFGDTLPPQKLDLDVVRVQRPKGIALQWNVRWLDPRCAPIESFHLFVCLESPSEPLVWSKVNEIHALPLPMACTLSRFPSFAKCYFVIQGRDVYGRYGPFCDIQCILTA